MAETETTTDLTNRSHKKQARNKVKKPPSWLSFNIFSSCKHHHQVVELKKNKKKKMISSKSSAVVMEPEPASRAVSATFSFNSSASVTTTFSSLISSSSSSLGGSFRETHPSLMATLCPCAVCGDIFLKPESLELHRASRHAVIDLGPEDTARGVVEIIFMSSWMMKNQQAPVCKIDRVLRVQNLHRTTSMFEDYRETIKAEASKQAKKHPRCMADGNELLRFHCTTFLCSLGPDGAAELCRSTPRCGVCDIVRNGFKADAQGKISTMASSRPVHGAARVESDGGKGAVLVCRVIAGRVKKGHERQECNSVICSDMDELCVYDPRAILPCFVVVYSGYCV